MHRFKDANPLPYLVGTSSICQIQNLLFCIWNPHSHCCRINYCGHRFPAYRKASKNHIFHFNLFVQFFAHFLNLCHVFQSIYAILIISHHQNKVNLKVYCSVLSCRDHKEAAGERNRSSLYQSKPTHWKWDFLALASSTNISGSICLGTAARRRAATEKISKQFTLPTVSAV